MGLFGPSRTKSIWDIIGRSDDMGPIDPGMSQGGGYDPSGPMSIPEQASPNDPAAQPKPGFFGAGGVGRGIAGSIGDYLLQMNHMAPVYAPAVQHQRDVQDRTQQFQMEQQGALATWKKQQEYKRENPDPMANDTERDAELIGRELGPEARKSYLSSRAYPDHYLEVDDGAGGKRIINTGGAPGSSQGMAAGGKPPPPPQAVARLLQNPGEVHLFASKYGQDVADAILNGGGAGPQAPRTFRSGLFGR